MLADAGTQDAAEAEPGATTSLKVIHEGKIVRTVALDKLCLSIGRAANNDLSLRDTGVSRHHAQIITVNGETIIEDLGSRNGTFVNQTWVRTRQLQHGDAILIAHYKLLFCEGTAVQARTVSELLRNWDRGFDQHDYDSCLRAARQQRLAEQSLPA